MPETFLARFPVSVKSLGKIKWSQKWVSGCQQIENAILGNYYYNYALSRGSLGCAEKKKTDKFIEHSCKIAPTLLSFSFASM